MATGEVGTFDEKSPPTRETFGNYTVWTQLTPYIEDIVNLGADISQPWYQGGDAMTKSLSALEGMVQDLLDLTKDLTSGDSPVFAGEAAEAFQTHVTKLVEKSRTGVQDVIRNSNFGAHTYGVGTIMKDFKAEFWAIVDAGHRLQDKLRKYASDQIDSIYSGVDAPTQREADRVEAMEAAYQAGERWILSNLRSLLMQLSQDYRDEGGHFPPLTVAVQENTTKPEDKDKDKDKDKEKGAEKKGRFSIRKKSFGLLS